MRITLARMRPLVSTSWLYECLVPCDIHTTSALRVLDASCDRDPDVDSYKKYYLQSHIPRASHFNLHYLCPRSPSSLEKFPVPDVNKFKDYMESLGVSNDTHVVTYDHTDSKFALKTWWLLRLFGHDNVSVLDGGFRKWLMDGYEVSGEKVDPPRSTYRPAFNGALLHTFEDMEEILKTQKKQVVDSRDAAAFYNDRDKLGDGNVGGHLPGSKNIPYTSLFEEDGTFKSPNELKELFEGVGVDLKKPLVATCQLAVSANGLAAAAFILGKEDVPVYNGSFLEWSQRAKPDQVVS